MDGHEETDWFGWVVSYIGIQLRPLAAIRNEKHLACLSTCFSETLFNILHECDLL
jgi:hypothetical protein